MNPLCTLRYSATHRNPYNLVYRLDPVRAFELRLVKQIVVASAAAQGGANDAFVRVEQIDYKKSIKAKLRIHVQTAEGPKDKLVTVKDGSDLFSVSNERACYQDGFVVAEINAEPGNEFLRFNNGRVMRLGEESGGMRDDVWRAQIKHTVKKHLEKELQLRGRDVKVLSLFFIDRVANYRDYDGSGQPVKGKFAENFEATLAEFAKDSRYKELEWMKLPMDRLHNGYFAADKKGVLKDTRGDTQADDEVYTDYEGERAVAFRRGASPIHLQPFGTPRRLGQSERVPDLHAKRNPQCHEEATRDWPGIAFAGESVWTAGIRRIDQQAIRHGQREL